MIITAWNEDQKTTVDEVLKDYKVSEQNKVRKFLVNAAETGFECATVHRDVHGVVRVNLAIKVGDPDARSFFTILNTENR